MTNNTKAISFWNFLKENTIEIPIIQRDYAQGRLGKENLRKTFLGDLKRALKDNIEMKLDFVYGSVEGGTLNPLDGQQRLTTLWLLHWYIALRAGVLNEENCKIFQRFTYEIRISSREFCKNLCNPKYFEKFDGNDIVGFITKQTWFYSAWKQDPTIQSMLRMLGGTKINDKNGDDIIDGIEELFDCPSECDIIKNTKCLLLRVFHKYWNKLTSDDCPIVFFHLPLQDFGLSDDLYIKMNARGKQLTSFENFKADLIGYITKQSENEQAEWKELLAPESGIPIKLDTDWTDIFWKNKSKGITDNESKTRKSNQIDEIYFAFLNRFFWNELFIAKDKDSKYILDIGKGDENSTKENENASYKYLNDSDNPNDYDTKIAYKGFDVYKYYNDIIPITFFEKMKNVLNNVSAYLIKYNSIPECPWDENFYYIPEYDIDKDKNNVEITNNASDRILKVTILNQVQRIVFFSICKFFNHDNTVKDDDVSLKQWLRVVWNLVSGEDENGRPQIRSTQAVRTAIGFIEKLKSHDVYNSLISYKDDLGDSDFDERCKEEIAKANQILCGIPRTDRKTWEEIIIEAEEFKNEAQKYLFKGTIRFLYTNGEGTISWNDFDTKWRNAQGYFNGNNIIPTTNIAEYFTDDQIKVIFNRFSFNTKNWKSILLQKSIFEPVHRFLLGVKKTTSNSELLTDIRNILDSIGQQDIWLLQDWQACNVVLTNYSQRRAEPFNGWVFEVGNEIRNNLNKVVCQMEDELTICVPPASGNEKYEINSCLYFRGLWMDLILQKQSENYYFRYYGNNTICLMDNSNKNCQKLKDPTKPNTEENHYYICIGEKDNKETIRSKLNQLIEDSSPNSSINL